MYSCPSITTSHAGHKNEWRHDGGNDPSSSLGNRNQLFQKKPSQLGTLEYVALRTLVPSNGFLSFSTMYSRQGGSWAAGVFMVSDSSTNLHSLAPCNFSLWSSRPWCALWFSQAFRLFDLALISHENRCNGKVKPSFWNPNLSHPAPDPWVLPPNIERLRFLA